MKIRNIAFSFIPALLTALFLDFSPAPASPVEKDAVSEEKLIAIGEAIYRNGMMANGEPVRATVLGDVKVSGKQFTCIHCHRRSGLGGPEGNKYVAPTSGPELFSPRKNVYLDRPAYTEKTLVEALASGMNPGGEKFDEIMPIYDLPELEMAGLVAYLKQLSAEFSPGMDEENLHIATVVDTSVGPEKREAMLSVINQYFKDKNSQSRIDEKRKAEGPFYHEYKNKAYRNWVLHVWELKGDPDSWEAQLESYYRQQPVFLMFSGLVNGSWEPIHTFSERNRIPTILPNTSMPVINHEQPDFYTLYYSKGMALEAEVGLTDILENTTAKNVLQVYRLNSAGAYGADYFRRLAGSESVGVHDLAISEDHKIEGFAEIVSKMQQVKADTLVFWLNAADLEALAASGSRLPDKLSIYLSASLLDGELSGIPGFLRNTGKVLHPFNLPENNESRFRRVSLWLKARKIPLTSPLLQGQTFFACTVLGEGLMHIKRNFYRDYLLDVIDHIQRMAGFVGNYPRVSFGPEQRYLAKGAYILDLQTGQARWIVADF